MKWQPIETAPKGKEIIRYFPTKKGRNALSQLINVGYGSVYGSRKATHWMPLPEPPETES